MRVRNSILLIGGFLIAIAAQFNTYPVMVVGMIFEGIGAECGVVSAHDGFAHPRGECR